MESTTSEHPDLPTIDRHALDELCAAGLLSATARAECLALISPRTRWGVWAARILSCVGTALTLSGILYFFAYNWASIGTLLKFGSVEIGIAASLAGAYVSGLDSLRGKLLLLSASVLVGVFLAVFGQIYQTGADASSLFLTWALLILPWAVLGNFSALWITWAVVLNVGLVLWFGEQGSGSSAIPLIVLGLMNTSFLALREYWGHVRGAAWIQSEQWSRVVLALAVLSMFIFPMTEFVTDFGRTSPSETIAAMLGYGVLALFYHTYRTRLPSRAVFAATLLAIAIVVECLASKIILPRTHSAPAFALLAMAAVTIAIFGTAISHYRQAKFKRRLARVER